MKSHKTPYLIKTIAEEHHFWSLPKPKHPMVSVYSFENTKILESLPELFMFDFYCISIKKNFKGKCIYGQHHYDFNSGVMTFLSPNQIMSHPRGDDAAKEGMCLVFHKDFLMGYPLAGKIRDYGFFSYELSEALHLSEDEEIIIEEIMANISREYQLNIDYHTQDVVIAQIELLLQYCNRFYNRQFITRKHANNEILINLENLLHDYFNDKEKMYAGLPTVQYVADALHLSPNYLSDMLRSLTGQTTQQHIHSKIIEKAKELLSTTSLSVSEIAFQLGFEYPQSFNKLFKNKINISPSEFRKSFN